MSFCCFLALLFSFTCLFLFFFFFFLMIRRPPRSTLFPYTTSSDPVGAGFVESLGRPGGNATGFITYEYSLSGKWLELLKQAAPHVTRAVVLRDASVSGIGQFSAVQAVAQSFGVELIPLGVRVTGMIEQGVTA